MSDSMRKRIEGDGGYDGEKHKTVYAQAGTGGKIMELSTATEQHYAVLMKHIGMIVILGLALGIGAGLVSCKSAPVVAVPVVSALDSSAWRFVNEDGVVHLFFGVDGVVSFVAEVSSSRGTVFDLGGDGMYLITFGGENADAITVADDMFGFLGMIFVQQAGDDREELPGTRWTATEKGTRHTFAFGEGTVVWAAVSESTGSFTDAGDGTLILTFDDLGVLSATVAGSTITMGKFVFEKL
jgi:hypothetical protein